MSRAIQRRQKPPDQFRSNTLPRFQTETDHGNSMDLPDVKITKEKKREMIREMMRTVDGEISVASAGKISPLKRIRDGVQADLKSHEREMFTLDRLSLDTFSLPGKPIPTTIMPHENNTHKSRTKKLKQLELARDIPNAGNGASGTAVSTTAKEFSFLPGVIGTSQNENDAENDAIDPNLTQNSETRPLSDLEEISEIMSRIHTGDDAINFFARFGSDTPVIVVV